MRGPIGSVREATLALLSRGRYRGILYVWPHRKRLGYIYSGWASLVGLWIDVLGDGIVTMQFIGGRGRLHRHPADADWIAERADGLGLCAKCKAVHWISSALDLFPWRDP